VWLLYFPVLNAPYLVCKHTFVWLRNRSSLCLANDLSIDHYLYKLQQEPSFELSGKLAAETNRVRGG
jgi:hypothetical protein